MDQFINFDEGHSGSWFTRTAISVVSDHICLFNILNLSTLFPIQSDVYPIKTSKRIHIGI